MRSAASALLLCLLAAAGCGPTRGPLAVPERLTPGEVLAAHNAWADSIEHVWSRAAIMLNLPNPEKRGDRFQYDMDGHLFLMKPDSLFLHGQVLGKEVFKVGLNADRFWLWIGPRANTIWHGKRGGEGERRFILSPADLMTALGVFRIDLEPGALAGFHAMQDAYVLVESRQLGGERVPSRQIWFDRATLRPIRVDLFDDVGRRILMAELMTYEPVGRTPVCTTYRVRFYSEEEVDLVLRLSDVSLEKPVNPKVFEFRVPPEARTEDLDAEPDAKAPE